MSKHLQKFVEVIVWAVLMLRLLCFAILKNKCKY